MAVTANKAILKIKNDPLLLIALPISVISLLLIFILRPIIRVRIALLHSDRLGHFTVNTVLYLCERDLDKGRHRQIDLHYLTKTPAVLYSFINRITRETCNSQLAIMWKRELNILPWFFLRPLDLIIRSF